MLVLYNDIDYVCIEIGVLSNKHVYVYVFMYTSLKQNIWSDLPPPCPPNMYIKFKQDIWSCDVVRLKNNTW